MKNSVKQSINILQKLYVNGLIPYPRVSNNFEKKPFFELFPHPPLPILEGINESIKFDKIKINKQSSLLLLNLMKLLKPSKIEKISIKIDSFFDDELEFINDEQKVKFEKISTLFEAFLQEKNLTEKDILNYSNNFFSEENKEMTSNSLKIYEVPTLFFSKDKKDKKKNKYLFSHKPIGTSELIKDNESEIDSILTIINAYRRDSNDLNTKDLNASLNK